MARVDKNLFLSGVRGMIGKQFVIKTRAGKQYISAAPEIDEHRVPTVNQQASRAIFRRCAAYAKAVSRDPEKRKQYIAVVQPGQTVYNIALRDARKPPMILSITAKGYAGTAGNIVLVKAMDDFKVAMVKVSIRNKSGVLLEEGSAETDDSTMWIYECTQTNADIPGTIIKATAFDLPGNEGAMEIGL